MGRRDVAAGGLRRLLKSPRERALKMRSYSISGPFCTAEKPRHERGHALPTLGFGE
jgi:hypothetical protein